MDLEISKEPSLKELLDAVKDNTREQKMTQKFLYQIQGVLLDQKKILQEIKTLLTLR